MPDSDVVNIPISANLTGPLRRLLALDRDAFEDHLPEDRAEWPQWERGFLDTGSSLQAWQWETAALDGLRKRPAFLPVAGERETMPSGETAPSFWRQTLIDMHSQALDADDLDLARDLLSLAVEVGQLGIPTRHGGISEEQQMQNFHDHQDRRAAA